MYPSHIQRHTTRDAVAPRPDVKAKFIRMRDYIMNVHSTLRGSIEDAMVCAVGASHRMMSNLLRRL